MNNIYFVIGFLLHICPLIKTIQKTYFNGYKIVEVGGVGEFDNHKLYSKLNLFEKDGIEILHRDKKEGTAHVLIRPGILKRFEEAVKENEFSYKVVKRNVGWEIMRNDRRRADAKSLDGESTFERYMKMEEIRDYLNKMKRKHQNNLKVTTIGRTINGVNMLLASISKDINAENQKPIIFIEGGIHAREWISISAAVYVIHQLLNTSSKLAEDVEWRILPVMNPDGYIYSWKKNRFWRKNLRRFKGNPCEGVDLNRNFDAFWGAVPGASFDKCEADYAGASAFSEPESQAIRDAVLEVKHRIKGFVSIHCYGQTILTPPSIFRYNITDKCADQLERASEIMAKDIASETNAEFSYGDARKQMYEASGTVMDWVYLTAEAPLAFSFELRDKGEDGFLLRESKIIYAVSDFWQAMTALHELIVSNINPDHSAEESEASKCIQRTKLRI